jgi:hypothetical protein
MSYIWDRTDFICINVQHVGLRRKYPIHVNQGFVPLAVLPKPISGLNAIRLFLPIAGISISSFILPQSLDPSLVSAEHHILMPSTHRSIKHSKTGIPVKVICLVLWM